MSTRCRKLITTDKSAVIAKSILDATVAEGGQCDGCLADPSGTDESDGRQIFCETNDPLNQLVASETRPWRRRREFSGCARYRCKVLDSCWIRVVVETTDLDWSYAAVSILLSTN